MENPPTPAKPNRPRISKRTLALLIVLVPIALIAGRLARPAEPEKLSFTAKMRPVTTPVVIVDDGVARRNTIYSVHVDYQELYRRAKDELIVRGWRESPAGIEDNVRVTEFKKDRTDSRPGANSVKLYKDIKFAPVATPMSNGIPAQTAMGWTLIVTDLEAQAPDTWDVVWNRIRGESN